MQTDTEAVVKIEWNETCLQHGDSTTVMACRWGPHHHHANAIMMHDAHRPPCCPSIRVIFVTTLFLPLFLELFDCCAVLSTSVIVVAASAPIEVRGILCVRFVDKFK